MYIFLVRRIDTILYGPWLSEKIILSQNAKQFTKLLPETGAQLFDKMFR